MAVLVVAAAGAAIGWGVAGTVMGAQIGWLIGSAIGNSLTTKATSQHNSQQPLSDLRVTGTEYGQTIPYARGTVGIAGQLWWNTDRRPTYNSSTTTSSSGGSKGGGGGGSETTTTTTTITYDMDMLIGLVDREIIGVGRIWVNGALVYTGRSDATPGSILASEASGAWTRLTVYRGLDTDLPDPTYEAAIAASINPATDLPFGVGYAPAYRGRGHVFIQGLQLGENGHVPNIVFEVIVDGTVGGGPLDPYYTTNVGFLLHFDGSAGSQVFIDEKGHTVSVFEWDNHPATYLDTSGALGYGNACLRSFRGWPSVNGVVCTFGTGDFTAEALVRYDAVGKLSSWPIRDNGPGIFAFQVTASPLAGKIDVVLGGITVMALTGLHIEYSTQHHVAITRTSGQVRVFLNGVLVGGPIANTANFSGTYNFDIGYFTAGGLGWFFQDEVRWTNGVSRYSADFTPATSAFPEAQLASGNTSVPPTVAEVVTELCTRANMDPSWFDVTGLAGITRKVKYLTVSQITGTRSTLELLMSVYFFDMVVTDKVYFIARGGAAVATVPYADLGTVMKDEGGEPLALKKASDLELNAVISITYPNIDNDYQTDTQDSDRLISAVSRTVSDLQMAIGMVPSEAKAVANVMLLDQVVSLVSTRVCLPGKYTYINPADPFNVTAKNGTVYRVRSLRKIDSFPLLEHNVVFDDVSILDPIVVTDVDYASSTVVLPLAETIMQLLDIPILSDGDDDSGFYTETKGDGTPYTGTAIFASSNDVDYSRVATVLESAVFGLCTTILGNWTGPRVFDNVNSVNVDVGDGVLNSTTRDAVLNGAATNVFLIGSEIIQAVTATLLAPGEYKLTGLLRGYRGTEWAMTGHVADERACLLQGNGLRRILVQNNLLGIQRFYKGVTLGNPVSSVPAGTLFTDMAIGLKPFAPVNLRASRDDSGNMVFTLQRRSRLATRMTGLLGISVPLGEASEAYSVDIYTSGAYSTVVRTLTATTPSIPYSAAQQTTDGFAPGGPKSVRAYQISATVGRGYKLEGTV